MALAAAGSTPDVKLLDDGNIVMDAGVGKTLAFTIAANNTDPTAFTEKLDYAGGDEWLAIDGERTTAAPTKASMLTTFKYKMAGGIGHMHNCRPVTIRITNKVSGKNLDIKVTPTTLSGPEISLVAEGSEGCTYDAATKTVTIPNTNGRTFKLKAVAPTLASAPGTTGSSVAVASDWITVEPASVDAAEGIYPFTMASAQGSPESTTNTLTFTSAATTGTTVITVKLEAADI